MHMSKFSIVDFIPNTDKKEVSPKKRGRPRKDSPKFMFIKSTEIMPIMYEFKKEKGRRRRTRKSCSSLSENTSSNSKDSNSKSESQTCSIQATCSNSSNLSNDNNLQTNNSTNIAPTRIVRYSISIREILN